MEKNQKKYTFSSEDTLRRPSKKRHEPYKRRRLALFSVLFLSLALLLIFFNTQLFPREEPELSSEAPAEAFPLMDTEEPVTRLEIRLREEPAYALLSHEDGSLSVEGQDYFTLEENTAAAMLRYSGTMYAEEVLKRPEDLSAYGLDQPWLDITVDQTHFRIGSAVPTLPCWYALRNEDPCIYAIPRSLVSSLARSLNELHTIPQTNHLTDINIDYVYLWTDGGETLEFSRAAAQNSPLMTSFFLTLPYRYPAHAYRVGSDILPALPLLKPSGYAGHITAPEEAQQYGLDQPYAQINAADNLGNEISLCIGSQTGTARYMSLDDSGDVYLIDSDLLSFLSYARSDYLSEQFPSLIRMEQVKSVSVSFGEEDYILSIGREDADSVQFQLNGSPLEAEQGREIYEQIISIQHDVKCPELPADARIYLSVDFRLLDGSDYMVEYIDMDEDYLAIRADGEAHFMVKRNKLEVLTDMLQGAL